MVRGRGVRKRERWTKERIKNEAVNREFRTKEESHKNLAFLVSHVCASVRLCGGAHLNWPFLKPFWLVPGRTF